MNLPKRALRKFLLTLKIFKRKKRAKELGIHFVPPNFLYLPRFDASSVVIDAGCSYQADLSLYMMEHYGVRAFGVDPTHKHAQALKGIELCSTGRFKHLPLAISSDSGTLTFYESRQNESGSLISNHTNILHDTIVTYEVESVTLVDLLKRIDYKQVAMLKLDLEGAEYDLLQGMNMEDLLPFDQIFIEFHHHAVPQYCEEDTIRLVARIADMGFKVFSLDDHNYLFFQPKIG